MDSELQVLPFEPSSKVQQFKLLPVSHWPPPPLADYKDTVVNNNGIYGTREKSHNGVGNRQERESENNNLNSFRGEHFYFVLRMR